MSQKTSLNAEQTSLISTLTWDTPLTEQDLSTEQESVYRIQYEGLNDETASLSSHFNTNSFGFHYTADHRSTVLLAVTGVPNMVQTTLQRTLDKCKVAICPPSVTGDVIEALLDLGRNRSKATTSIRFADLEEEDGEGDVSSSLKAISQPTTALAAADGEFGMQRAGQESRETTIQNGHRKISQHASIPRSRLQNRLTKPAPSSKSKMQRAGQESRETTIQNGYAKISEIANILPIPIDSHHVEAAQRYFNLAVMNNFTKGRKLQDVSAACLYIVCRMGKTAHMLIDFADALNVNVYALGRTFVRLRDILHLPIPIVDLALYISRFAARLDFQDSTQDVVTDANRLVQRMNRDWLHLGRRPAGICAACLYIAARMHGFNRTPREIVLQVKICEATLKARLAEFSKTPSAQLTVKDFKSIWLDRAEDPPAFARHQTKRHVEGRDAGDERNGEEETDSVNASGKATSEDGDEAGSGSNDRRKPSENGISNEAVNGEDEEDMETLVDEVQKLIDTDATLAAATPALDGTTNEKSAAKAESTDVLEDTVDNNGEDLDTLDRNRWFWGLSCRDR
ncbi:transcription factor TFIIIB subunit brf1 [Rhizophlyctis rosea]|nr:transcription factor TFIIIB subunit brf1 [Rhizophlyctis rosea]